MKTEIKEMTRLQVICGIIEFTKIYDFEYELEYMGLEISPTLDGAYPWCDAVTLTLDNELMFYIGAKETIYCPCCGPMREFKWVSVKDMTTEDLRIILDYLDLRLDKKCS
jgi:hypothetical protein